MRLRLLHGYLAREVTVPFLLGLFIFTFFLLMFQVLKITEMVVNYGISVVDVFKVTAYILPPFLVFTIPMAFLLAVIVAIGRLASDSELVAIKAAGVSLGSLYPPVLAVSLLAFTVTAFLSLHADPWGKQQFKRMLFEVGRKNATLGIKPQVFNDQFKDLVIFVQDIDPGTQQLAGVFISDERNPEVPNIITAAAGRLTSSDKDMKLVIRLEHGALHRTPTDDSIYESVSFDRYDLVLDFSTIMEQATVEKSYTEMTLPELAAFIGSLAARGDDAYVLRRAQVEYQRKFAFPFACVVFGLIGLPLGVVAPRSGRGQGFTTAIVLCSTYYLLFRVGENLGWKGVVPPAAAMWFPNVLFGALGIWLLRLKSAERPIAALEWLGNLGWRLRSAFGRLRRSGAEADAP